MVQQPTDPTTSDANSDSHTPPNSGTPMPPPKPQPPTTDEPHSGGWWSYVAIAAVVLIAGSLGAAWYFQFWPFAAAHEKAPAVAGGEPTAPAPASPSASQADEDRVSRKEFEDLAARLDKLQQHLGDLSKPSAEYQQFRSRLNTLESLPGKVQDLTDKVAVFDGRLGSAEQSIMSLREEVVERQQQDLIASQDTQEKHEQALAKPDLEKKLDTAISAFREEHYHDARQLFDDLREAHPEDARVWYYSALATGLTTGEWNTTAANYAREGVDCERDGHPDANEIDKALEGLTTRNGKDWIAGYRRQAKAASPSE